MPSLIGRTLGPYRIVEPLGKGGMGEVWLAEDTRLERKVAIKVLPAEVAAIADRRQRFEQEARASATLNHPHIAAVHDVGVETVDGDAVHFMVQEYLEGETLRELLARGPLPFERARTLAIEIGEAIRAAHRAGIVHRDLKPDNVFVTRDGHAKVLDFGLAKLTELNLPSGSGPSMSPTMTMAGQMLGTAGYMAPEQVRGEEVDERADLFALGCILYEMLTGRQAFGGDNVHESLSRILSGEPEPLAASASGSGPRCGWILDKLLAKDREQRYQSAADVVVDLRRLGAEDSLASGPVAPPVASTTRARRRSPFVTVALVVGALLVGAVATRLLLSAREARTAFPDVRFDVMLPEGQGFSSNYNRVLTISPDSRTLAYLSEGLWLRSLDSTEARLVPESVAARSPAFSPDSRQIAFWESGHVKRVSLDGGAPIILQALPQRPMGMQWADDGFLYVGRADMGIWRVPAAGGEFEPFLTLAEGEYAHGPELLPGGEWMLFSLSRGVRAWYEGSIVAQSLKDDERRVLVRRGREARYLPNGYLTYVQDNTLFAVPFDLGRMQTTGAAVAIETDVHTSASDETGAAGYDFSDDGVMVVAPPSGIGSRMSRLFFTGSDDELTPLPFGPRRFGLARLSPDGTRIAAQINDLEGTHVWILDVDRDGAQRLTTRGRNTSPVWSHDGRFVYFASVQEGVNDIWRRPADLSAPAEKVLAIVGAEMPDSASSDGRWLYFSRMSPSNSDLARVSLVGEPEVEVLVDSPADESDARVSPDGRFIAFQSNETGRWDIHVMELESGRRWVVSSRDGFRPIWSPDGGHILYMSGASVVYRVRVRTEPGFVAGEPVRVLEARESDRRQPLDVLGDGGRVLVAIDELPEDRTEIRPHFTVVMDGYGAIERRVGR